MLALIMRAGFRAPGIHFFTPNEFSQQLGYMNRPRGYVIPQVLNPVAPRARRASGGCFSSRAGVSPLRDDDWYGRAPMVRNRT